MRNWKRWAVFFGLVFAVLAVPAVADAQASGCVAVTYGCPVSGPTLEFPELTEVQRQALMSMIWVNLVIIVFFLFTV